MHHLCIRFSVWWSEISLFLLVVEMRVRGGGAHTSRGVYNQQILILRTRVEVSISFKDLAIKATSSKPLSLADSPCSCSTACVQPLLMWLHLLIYASDLAGLSSDDQSCGNYGWHICSIFIPFLSSLGFTLILFSQQSDRLPLVFFFFQLYLGLSLCHRSPQELRARVLYLS